MVVLEMGTACTVLEAIAMSAWGLRHGNQHSAVALNIGVSHPCAFAA